MAEEEKVEKAPAKKAAAASETKAVKKTTTKKTTTTATKKTTTAKKTTTKKVVAEEAPVVEEKVAVKKAPKAKGECKKAAVVSRVQVDYKERIVPELQKQYGYKSVMEVPHLEKIVINMGVGEAASNSKAIEEAMADCWSTSSRH